MAFTLGMARAEEKSFTGTGVFQGQGRGCWGKLYIREKSLEWNTPYSICKRTSYSIIQKEMESKSPHIAFALANKSKKCGFEIIELSFDPAYPAYWQAIGYETRKDFENKATNAEETKLKVLSCSVQKLD
jgi:hypothetical protein